jgi:hypothetical protein
MSCLYATQNPNVTVLVMDLAEEGDLTKRLLGGVESSKDKVKKLCGGIFKLLDSAKNSGGLTSWLWSDGFDIEKHAIKVAEHNPHVPDNVLLIASGAWPHDKTMTEAERKKICCKISAALQTSPTTWKLFCDTDGDRRPSDFTLIAYGLCSHAIVPLHLNKGDLDRTETMLGIMQQYRKSGETKAQVAMIVWNFVNMLNGEPMDYKGVRIPFTPTKVNLDILDTCNRRLFGLSQSLEGLFVHGEASEEEFFRSSACLLKQLPDNVLKPSEETGEPFVEMMRRLDESGKKSLMFKTGEAEYTAQEKVIQGANAAMEELESKFEAMVLSGGKTGTGGYNA